MAGSVGQKLSLEEATPMGQEPHNITAVETGSMEQESNNTRVEGEFAASEVQPQKSPTDKELLDQIAQALKDQMSDFVHEMKALAQAPQQTLAMVPLSMIKAEEVDVTPKRGRRPTTSLLGEIFFAFELPEICTKNNMDLDKMLLAHSGPYARKFLVTERLQNWNVQLKKRVHGGQDTYFCHLPSQQRFRSKVEVVQFVLNETYPPKPFSKTKKDPGSASRASTIARKRSSDPQEIEIEKKMTNDEQLKEN